LGDSAADSSALHGAGITLGGTNIVDKPSFTYSHAGQRFVFNRNIQADSFYGDVTGNVTGNVTGDVVGDLTGNVTGQVSDISNHTTTDLAEGNNKYFTIPRARNTIQAVDAGGDGSFIYDSSTGTMTYTGPSPTEVRAHVSLVDNGGDGEMSYDAATGIISYTGPSEAEWYQHFVDNADSLGDMVWDSNYGTKGGLRLHERHILGLQETGVDSFVAAQEFIMYYSGTAGSLRKLNLNTFSSLVGGGGGGSKLFGFINL
jgi:hypothetical protein